MHKFFNDMVCELDFKILNKVTEASEAASESKSQALNESAPQIYSEIDFSRE